MPDTHRRDTGSVVAEDEITPTEATVECAEQQGIRELAVQTSSPCRRVSDTIRQPEDPAQSFARAARQCTLKQWLE